MISNSLIQQILTYIPEEWRQVLAQGLSLPEKAEGAALFADISGFTPISEALSRVYGVRKGTEELSRYINEVYDGLTTEVTRFHGSVIGFAGDAITCWFDNQVRYPTGMDLESKVLTTASQRAAACGLAIQATLHSVSSIHLQSENQFTLSVKIAIASGFAQRFLVGDPGVQRIPVMAGDTVQRMADGEHLAQPSEVLVDETTIQNLMQATLLGEARLSQRGDKFWVLGELRSQLPALPWPALSSEEFREDQLRPWLLPTVFERLKGGMVEFLTELRPATALFMRFTDIDYEDDPSAGNKLNDLICQVQAEVNQYEGSLIDVTVGDKGSYLYCVFGAPVAHEDDAHRAVCVARDLRELATSLPWLESVQIGISMGTMRTGAFGGSMRHTYGVIGDEVNLAARLMAKAEPGDVLISSRVYKAISGDVGLHSFDFTFEPHIPIQLQGISEPVPVFAMSGVRQKRAMRLQEPVYALPMVGRQVEMARLEEKMELVLQSQGQVIGITGEAGMGKSRLVAEVIRMARRKGLVGYGGACQADGTNISYLVWNSIWRAIFELNPDAPLHRQIHNLVDILEELAPTRIESMPLLSPMLGITIPDNPFTTSLEPRARWIALGALLLDSLQSACRQAALESMGLLLVLEDLQWIDPLSLNLLGLLAAAIQDLPVMILLAYRPPEQQGEQPLSIEELPYFYKFTLSDLTTHEAEQAVRAKLIQLYPEWRGAIPISVMQRVITQAEGNPFYAEELLNYLHDQDIDLRDSRTIETLELPTSLHSLILSRIDRLNPHQQLTLKVASIIGRHFHFRHLLGYYPDLGPNDRLKTNLNVLAGLDLTPQAESEPELAYIFRHIITQEVAYESLPTTTRVGLHELYARYLENLAGDNQGPYLNLLAYHYDHSENRQKKLEYLPKAANAAASNYANEDAILYYRHLLVLLDEPDAMGRNPAKILTTSEMLADILHFITRYDEAILEYRRSLINVPEADLVKQADLVRKIGNCWRDKNNLSEAINAYAEALNILGSIRRTPQDQVVAGVKPVESEESWWQTWIQIYLEKISVHYWQAQVQELDDACQVIMPVVKKYGTPMQRAGFLHSQNNADARRYRYRVTPEMTDRCNTILEIYQNTGLTANIPAARFQYGFYLVLCNELEQAETELVDALQLSEQRGDLNLQSRCLNYLTVLHRKQGQVPLVEAFAHRTLLVAKAAHMPNYVGAAWANQAWVAWKKGNFQLAKDQCQAAIELWESDPAIRSMVMVLYWLAVWPMLGIHLADNQLALAISDCHCLLEPNQIYMPEELIRLLQQAVYAWEAHQADTTVSLVQKSLALAEQMLYL